MALAPADKLRLMLGERIPSGGAATDTFFSDDEIADLIEATATLNAAAVLGWGAKAAEYARLIDLNESGGDRKLSQRYRQAMTTMTFYQTQADKDVAVLATAGRVPGKSISLTGSSRDQLILYTKRYNRMPVLDLLEVTDPSNITLISDDLDDQ